MGVAGTDFLFLGVWLYRWIGLHLFPMKTLWIDDGEQIRPPVGMSLLERFIVVCLVVAILSVLVAAILFLFFSFVNLVYR